MAKAQPEVNTPSHTHFKLPFATQLLISHQLKQNTWPRPKSNDREEYSEFKGRACKHPRAKCMDIGRDEELGTIIKSTKLQKGLH